MQVFKLGLKIIRKNIPMMMIYVGTFLGITISFAFAGTSRQQPPSFADQKADVAFFAAESTPLVDGLKRELSKSVNFVDVRDDPEAIQDALYFESVTYVVRIPKGFTGQFLAGKDAKVEKITLPDSVYNAYLDLAVNRYLSTARLYLKNDPGISQRDLAARLDTDLSKGAKVFLTDTAGRDNGSFSGYSHTGFTAFYFIYLAYVLPLVLIFGITNVMAVYNDRDLSRRNFCAPISFVRYNLQFILATCAFSLAAWVILVLPCAILDRNGFFTGNAAAQVLNSFAFLLCASAFAFLIGSLVKGRSTVSAVANVFTLGPCFISGVFIPQKYLNDAVLRIASFTPVYWYVTADNKIAELTDFGLMSLSPSLFCMLVELCFAAAFLLLGLVVGKKRRAAD